MSCVTWPRYTLENPRNIVFNGHVANSASIEPDIHRAEGIVLIAGMQVSLNNR